MKLATKLFATTVVTLAMTTGTFAKELNGRLAQIAERGSIVLGHRESSVPFAYLDENQKPIGYSIDLCMKVVEGVEETVGRDLADDGIRTRR